MYAQAVFFFATLWIVLSVHARKHSYHQKSHHRVTTTTTTTHPDPAVDDITPNAWIPPSILTSDDSTPRTAAIDRRHIQEWMRTNLAGGHLYEFLHADVPLTPREVDTIANLSTIPKVFASISTSKRKPIYRRLFKQMYSALIGADLIYRRHMVRGIVNTAPVKVKLLHVMNGFERTTFSQSKQKNTEFRVKQANGARQIARASLFGPQILRLLYATFIQTAFRKLHFTSRPFVKIKGLYKKGKRYARRAMHFIMTTKSVINEVGMNLVVNADNPPNLTNAFRALAKQIWYWLKEPLGILMEKALEELLWDKRESRKVQRKRARIILEIGKIFREESRKAPKELDDGSTLFKLFTELHNKLPYEYG